MFNRYAVQALVGACFVVEAFAQTPRVDFARDVQPIFRQNCIGCHGPSQANAGMRLDRKSSVFKSGLRRVVAGSSENSFLYYRVSGTAYGLQMPPSGPLRAEQISTVKAWIDQGAEWPDALANEADLPPLDPKAVALVDKLRNGDRPAFLKAVAEDPKLLNARGPEGSTPFLYAVLYGDAPMLEQLLKKGANPNLRNDAGATALMWAATNLEKTRVLLAHGAEVNTLSTDMRTPLMVAAGRPGGTPIVKLLLEHGANPNPTRNPDSDSSPLIQAALAADPESIQLLIDRGADIKASGAGALVMAETMDCPRCVDLLMKQNLDKGVYTFTLLQIAPFAGANAMRAMLDHGAEVDAVDPFGRTALAYAAGSDLIPVDAAKLLIERGANVNAKSSHGKGGDAGMSVLDIARLHGETPMADLLVKAGATSAVAAGAAPQPRGAGSAPGAIERSLPLLQRADAAFTAKAGCVSCHNNSLAAMAVGLARKNGFGVDERISAQQVKINAAYLDHQRDALHQGFFTAQAGAQAAGDIFGPGVLGYVVMGLDAERYQPDLNTDAVAMYLKSRQMLDGHWAYPATDLRQPLCADYIGQTTRSMRALQLYAPKAGRPEYDKAIQLAAAWIEKADAKTTEDRIWRLLGMAWAGRDKDAIMQAQRELVSRQRADGGWAELASMESNAYVTGRALVTLQAAGLPVSDPAYRRGVEYLLANQMEDGSWYVKTRALAIQPYFDTGFPHGFNQSISAAGTSWATMALTLGSQPPAGKTVSGAGAR